MPHRIRRLRVRVPARSREQAFMLRPRLRDVVSEAVLPSLEQVFDEIAPGDQVVHVVRLELHATVHRIEDLASVLPELVRRELAGAHLVNARSPGQAVASRSDVARASPAPQDADGAVIGPPGVGADVRSQGAIGDRTPVAAQRTSRDAAAERALAPDVHDEATPSVDRRSMHGDRVHALARYLETGAFPWHVDAVDAIRAVIAELSLEDLAHAAVDHSFERSPAAAIAAYFRLLQLVPRSRWVALARSILATAKRDAAPAIEAVAALAGTSDLAPYRLLRIAAVVIGAARTDPAPIDDARLVAFLIGTDDATAARSIVEAELARLPPPVAAVLRHRASSLAAPPPPAAPDSGHRAAASARHPPASSQAIARPPVEDSFGIPARYAGLIVLHPFLSRLFEQTDVKRPGAPALDPAALPRAAALLHACATGEDEPFEHDLGFVKILLGLVPETSLLVAGGLLSAADRAEVDGLLGAVVDHWAALKKTSVHGLRSTFLCRAGLVREEEQGFRLQVEPTGFDVLLSRLPWGIATVKLPWMPKAIFTEWSTS